MLYLSGDLTEKALEVTKSPYNTEFKNKIASGNALIYIDELVVPVNIRLCPLVLIYYFTLIIILLYLRVAIHHFVSLPLSLFLQPLCHVLSPDLYTLCTVQRSSEPLSCWGVDSTVPSTSWWRKPKSLPWRAHMLHSNVTTWWSWDLRWNDYTLSRYQLYITFTEVFLLTSYFISMTTSWWKRLPRFLRSRRSSPFCYR